MRRRRLLLLLVAALLPAGCGGTSGGGATADATLLLDSAPNAVHAGIYTALARDYDGAQRVRLRVRAPSSSADAVRLLESERVDAAILDITDLARARARGRDIVGVMAVVQRPLTAVFAQPGVRTPEALEGRRVGVTGLPSDVAVLRSIVSGAGGDPARVRRTTVGSDPVPALLGGRVAAVTASWNADGVALERAREGRAPFREFRVDRYGAPAYPELVLCVTRATLQDDPDLVRRLVLALRRGYEEALADPESAVETLLRRNRGLAREPTLEELRAVSPAFTAGVERPGQLDRRRLRAWAAWAVRFGLVEQRPDVDLAFAPDVAR